MKAAPQSELTTSDFPLQWVDAVVPLACAAACFAVAAWLMVVHAHGLIRPAREGVEQTQETLWRSFSVALDTETGLSRSSCVGMASCIDWSGSAVVLPLRRAVLSSTELNSTTPRLIASSTLARQLGAGCLTNGIVPLLTSESKLGEDSWTTAVAVDAVIARLEARGVRSHNTEAALAAGSGMLILGASLLTIYGKKWRCIRIVHRSATEFQRKLGRLKGVIQSRRSLAASAQQQMVAAEKTLQAAEEFLTARMVRLAAAEERCGKPGLLGYVPVVAGVAAWVSNRELTTAREAARKAKYHRDVDGNRLGETRRRIEVLDSELAEAEADLRKLCNASPLNVVEIRNLEARYGRHMRHVVTTGTAVLAAWVCLMPFGWSLRASEQMTVVRSDSALSSALEADPTRASEFAVACGLLLHPDPQPVVEEIVGSAERSSTFVADERSGPVCVTGRRCGATCIPRDRVCRTSGPSLSRQGQPCGAGYISMSKTCRIDLSMARANNTSGAMIPATAPDPSASYGAPPLLGGFTGRTLAPVNPSQTYVRPYVRSDGVTVNGHYRTNPNGSTADNLSTHNRPSSRPAEPRGRR